MLYAGDHETDCKILGFGARKVIKNALMTKEQKRIKARQLERQTKRQIDGLDRKINKFKEDGDTLAIKQPSMIRLIY